MDLIAFQLFCNIVYKEYIVVPEQQFTVIYGRMSPVRPPPLFNPERTDHMKTLRSGFHKTDIPSLFFKYVKPVVSVDNGTFIDPFFLVHHLAGIPVEADPVAFPVTYPIGTV